jgi:hypothetical protein
MQVYEIRSDIPVPKKRSWNHKGAARYPIDKMKVGDSFFVPSSTAKYTCVRQYLFILTKKQLEKGQTKKRLRFHGKELVENGVEGSRHWRIE